MPERIERFNDDMKLLSGNRIGFFSKLPTYTTPNAAYLMPIMFCRLVLAMLVPGDTRPLVRPSLGIVHGILCLSLTGLLVTGWWYLMLIGKGLLTDQYVTAY